MDRELFLWVARRLAALGDHEAAWVVRLIESMPRAH